MIYDCRYCEYCCCDSPDDESLACFVEDFEYFDHNIDNPSEAETCEFFMYCDIFPKL